MKKLTLLFVAAFAAFQAQTVEVGLPLERLAMPVVTGSHLVCIWDDSAQSWIDPDFDPSVPSFYYARVIEIPTPRWTAYEAKRFGIKMPPEAEMITQERAYTSPVWYSP